jgi:hypothetical protein
MSTAEERAERKEAIKLLVGGFATLFLGKKRREQVNDVLIAVDALDSVYQGGRDTLHAIEEAAALDSPYELSPAETKLVAALIRRGREAARRAKQ